MSVSNFPNGFPGGVLIRGLPIAITHPGEVFWVNGSTVAGKGASVGSDTGKGTFKQPFATIDYAIGRCTASRGDIIMVMPGHAETISAAAGIVFDVAGVALVGLGTGSLKPTITLDTATSTDIDVTAANVSISNVRVVSGIANLVHGIQVTGAECAIENSEFRASVAATAILTSVITTATAYGFRFVNNVINMESSIAGLAVTDVAASGVENLADNAVISNNSIMGNFSVAGIYGQTTATEGVQINDNNIYNVSTSAAAGAVSLVANSSGTCYRNHATVLETSAITGLFINANLGMSENYAVNVVTETAGLVHTAST